MNFQRNGKGEFVFVNGRGVYTGDWKDDKRDGRGTLVIKHKDTEGEYLRYEGEWVDDKVQKFARTRDLLITETWTWRTHTKWM